MDYDKKLKELENIVNELEKDLPMEQSIELYTKGANLVKECLKELEETKGGIYKVKEELDKLVETKI